MLDTEAHRVYTAPDYFTDTGRLMPYNTNTVTICGNLTREPELRFTPSGQAVANFGVACNRSWNDRQTGEKQEQTSFFDVQVWREMAENVAESLNKGDRVLVTGRLEQRSWDTDDGGKRSKIELVAEEVGPTLRFASVTIHRNERKDRTNEPAPAPTPGQQPITYTAEEPF